MTKIALNVISRGKGEEENLDRALSSIATYVDAMYITFTSESNHTEKAEAVCRKYNSIISYYTDKKVIDKETIDWLRDFFGYEPELQEGDKLFVFDDARNFALSQVPKEYDWIVWMDTDDVFLNGQNLRSLAENAQKQNVEAVYLNYIYQAEVEGFTIKNRLIEHFRERLVRNNDHFKWIAPIHETLIEQVPTQKSDSPSCEVLHLATDEDRKDSLIRNTKNLEYAIYISKGEDPRHIYYLAKALYDHSTNSDDEKAMHLILRYLNGDKEGNHKSGWAEERQQAWEYLSQIYLRRGQHNNATRSVLNSFTEPSEPRPEMFLAMAKVYCDQQNWELGLFWVKQVLHVKEKKTTLVRNPKDLSLRTLEVLFNACLNLGQYDEAWAAAVKMKGMLPDDPQVIHIFNFIKDLRLQKDLMIKVAELADYLEQNGEAKKIRPLLEAVPAIVEQTPFYEAMAQKVLSPRIWGGDEIAFFVGQGVSEFTPRNLQSATNGFIGGSEEAVIYLARELQKQDYKVTVYNAPGDNAGEYEGVKYEPYYKMNKKDKFNILVAWRHISLFDLPIEAKKKYVWLHDIANDLDYPKERVDRIDKIIVLSEYHRSNLPSVPDDKILISSNGISLQTI